MQLIHSLNMIGYVRYHIQYNRYLIFRSENVFLFAKGRETVLMELTFMGLQYSDDLADPTSSSYLEVSEDIQAYVRPN